MRKYTLGEGISPVKEFDVTDVDAEKAAEQAKKEQERIARGSKPEMKKQIAAEQTMAKIKENLQKKQELAQAREDLAKISNKEIEGALNDLEAPEELSEEDLEKVN